MVCVGLIDGAVKMCCWIGLRCLASQYRLCVSLVAGVGGGALVLVQLVRFDACRIARCIDAAIGVIVRRS